MGLKMVYWKILVQLFLIMRRTVHLADELLFATSPSSQVIEVHLERSSIGMSFISLLQT